MPCGVRAGRHPPRRAGAARRDPYQTLISAPCLRNLRIAIVAGLSSPCCPPVSPPQTQRRLAPAAPPIAPAAGAPPFDRAANRECTLVFLSLTLARAERAPTAVGGAGLTGPATHTNVRVVDLVWFRWEHVWTTSSWRMLTKPLT